MSANSSLHPRVGAIRPSQMLYAYGVGALVDLPNFAVVVAGLQAWDRPEETASEPRLLAAVQAALGPQVVRLVAMPWKEETRNALDDWAKVGIPVIPFPRWMRCMRCNILSTIDGGLFTFEGNAYHPERARYEHRGCGKGKAPSAVPARFVMACVNGHLDEFPWQEFAHGYKPCAAGGGTLELTEPGSGTRSTEVLVKCHGCGASAFVAAAFDRTAKERPACRGRHPHLRTFERCSEAAQPLLLGASNTWFGITLSALFIPVGAGGAIDDDVDTLWVHLDIPPIRDEATLEQALTFNPTLEMLRAHSIADLWQAIERRRNGERSQAEAADLRRPEWLQFINPSASTEGADFTIAERAIPARHSTSIAQVVAATRLRETTASIAFARIDAPDPSAVDEPGAVHRVPLTVGPTYWVPAVESRGEGLFFRLPEERVRAWEASAQTKPRIARLRDAVLHRFGPRAWPATRYVLLHSLSHALMNEVALECGYNAASLRERIYAADENGGDPMAGILIYTAAPDSEGTLGGLVAMAETATFERVLTEALRRAMFCSSDPLCAEHEPSDDDGTQHGAACHSCLFVPETSCECNNRILRLSRFPGHLDRAGEYPANEVSWKRRIGPIAKNSRWVR